ncbi:chaB [Orgyia pseudotsugata single capsid nuclopolyhedrovirus]|nr:chaB [Orgyia pseudotsugata single capsid nuclopolyhedrovirus]
MSYLTDVQFSEQMPARAKRLYKKIFDKYHKLNGGDEEIALHLARKALEKQYVKLNERWYPKAAAELIVRHDMDEDDEIELNEEDVAAEAPKLSPVRKRRPTTPAFSSAIKTKKHKFSGDDASLENSDDDDDDDNDDDDFIHDRDLDEEIEKEFNTSSEDEDNYDDNGVEFRFRNY